MMAPSHWTMRWRPSWEDRGCMRSKSMELSSSWLVREAGLCQCWSCWLHPGSSGYITVLFGRKLLSHICFSLCQKLSWFLIRTLFKSYFLYLTCLNRTPGVTTKEQKNVCHPVVPMLLSLFKRQCCRFDLVIS
jgi:hypothetical protein